MYKNIFAKAQHVWYDYICNNGWSSKVKGTEEAQTQTSILILPITQKTSVETTKIISKFVNNRLNSLSRYPVYIFNKNNGISQPSSVLL